MSGKWISTFMTSDGVPTGYVWVETGFSQVPCHLPIAPVQPLDFGRVTDPYEIFEMDSGQGESE